MAGCLLELTPSLGVEDGAEARSSDKGCMASSTSPPVNKTRPPFPGEEREHLDDGASPGRYGS